MASICDYVRPGGQITDGLVRHGSGSRFPYNPEFYDRASSLYGPGSMCAWYLTFASVLLNWCFREKAQKNIPGISTDLLAVVLYAVFAATDLLVQAVRFVGTENRALAIFCVLWPADKSADRRANAPVELLHIPPDILSIGQRAIAISGPLRVCRMFWMILWVPLLGDFFDEREGKRWPSRTVVRLICLAYGYVSLVLTIFHLSIGDITHNVGILLGEAGILTLPLMIVACSLPLFLFFWLACRALRDARSVGSQLWWLLTVFILLAILVYLCAVLPWFASEDDLMSWIPDLGQSLTERDQLAALLAGILTFGFTLVSIILRRRKHAEVDPEERVPLFTGSPAPPPYIPWITAPRPPSLLVL